MKIGLFILCHHKPWLIRSSILSILSQKKIDNLNLHFILIKGNGESNKNKYYQKYNLLKKKYGFKNSQLSNFDDKILKELKKIKYQYKVHEVKNDHGLDSGAWVKFIKSSLWKKYDYNILLMEGFLFTSKNVLSSIEKFILKESPDFISSGHEKRFLKIDTKQINKNINNKNHNYFINNIWNELYKINIFKKIINKQKNYTIRHGKKIRNLTEHHTKGYAISFIEQLKLKIKSILYVNHWYKKNRSVLITSNRKFFIDKKEISKNFKSIENIDYHLDQNPFFYGCSCQHVFSKKMIKEMNIFFKKNKIYRLSKYPFFGEVFEIMWGVLPNLLNKKKWFFNGIHRVRKNFINYKREDDIYGMIKYLNFYNKGRINFYIKNNQIKYKLLDKELNNYLKFIN